MVPFKHSKDCCVKKLILSSIILISISVTALLGTKSPAIGFSGKKREILFKKKIILKNLPDDITDLRIWIPYPVSDNWQAISDLKIESLFDESLIIEKQYGNKIIYFQPKENIPVGDTSEIILSFKAKRTEYAPFPGSTDFYKNPSDFLLPNKSVPLNGKLKGLAENIARGKEADKEKARAVYNYLINELTYSKDDPLVCGIGSSLVTLEAKKGICTDYHSLFISLVRSLGIPAKFEIGYRIPEGENEGKIDGYHCWAKFYTKDEGWIPVDISEADKYPEKQDYFFGHIDENRVHFTTGRDITLEGAANSEPFNFFIYPYAEVGDSRFDDIDFEVTFKEKRRS